MSRILLIDDDEGIRLALTTMLGLYGYAVVEANEGCQALEILAFDTEIDLIVTDNKMNGMGGIEFIEEFKKLGRSIEIIMITATNNLLCAADYIIMKPFDSKCLLAAIEFSLAKHKCA